MGSESWVSSTLGEISVSPHGLVDGPFGSDLPASLYISYGIPVIRGSNLSLGDIRFKTNDFVFVSKETADRLSRSNCFPDDIIFTKKGTIGQTGIIPRQSHFSRFLLSSNQMKLSVDRRKADPLFVYYIVSSPESRAKIIQHASVTGVPKTNVAYLRQFPINLPPLPEQHAIAAVLGALDDKIELNRRMNRTLEAMARALFQSWFVDFDPVRAKMAGRPVGLPEEIAALFPGEMEEGRPLGWGIDSFVTTNEILGGGTPKTTVSDYWDGDIPWYSVVDAPTESDIYVIDTAKKITELGVKNSSTQLLSVGTVIISARGTVGKVALVGVPMAMNQSCYGLRGKFDPSGAYTYFSTRNLTGVLKQNTHGSVFDTITRDTLERVIVVTPPTELIMVYEEYVQALMAKIKNNLFQATTLAALRDALLPKLMSGEVRVPVAEEAAADAL